MMKCQECGAEISDSAMSCPKCGAKTALARKREDGNLLTVIVIGFMVTFAFFGYLIVDQYEEESRSTWIQNAVENLSVTDVKTEKVKQISAEAAKELERLIPVTKTPAEAAKEIERLLNVTKEDTPLSDEVLGNEYNLKESEGVWEVYKGNQATGFQALDRNECLKWVKSLRGS